MTTEERLEKLERELAHAKRRNRWLLAIVGLAVVGLGLAWTWNKTMPTAQAQGVAPAGKVIRANKFILEDANGKTRASLSVLDSGPGLWMYDVNGNPRVLLNVFDLESRVPGKPGLGSSGLSLIGKNGKSGAHLTVMDEAPRLMLSDDKHVERVSLSAGKDKTELMLTDEKGKVRAWLNIRKDGTALSLWDENRIASLSVNKDRTGLSLCDEKGKPRASLGVIKYGPALNLSDENGKVIWSVPR